MNPIAQNLEEVRNAIAEAAQRAGRDPGSVRLVAVSKTVDLERIRAAIAAGGPTAQTPAATSARSASRSAAKAALWNFAEEEGDFEETVSSLSACRRAARLAEAQRLSGGEQVSFPLEVLPNIQAAMERSIGQQEEELSHRLISLASITSISPLLGRWARSGAS